MGQSVGEEQVATTGVPPPMGVEVNMYDEKGPPTAGGEAVTVALVDVLGIADTMIGALQITGRTSDSQFATMSIRFPHTPY